MASRNLAAGRRWARLDDRRSGGPGRQVTGFCDGVAAARRCGTGFEGRGGLLWQSGCATASGPDSREAIGCVAE